MQSRELAEQWLSRPTRKVRHNGLTRKGAATHVRWKLFEVPMVRQETELRADSPATQRKLISYQFGTPGAGAKAYLQAGLHADEMPGILVLQHLIPLLEAAELTGKIAGHIILVPLANPIGLSQWAFQRPLGRQEAGTLHNFNRGFPELAALVATKLEDMLTQSVDANRDIIRNAFRAALAEQRAAALTEMTELQAALLQWSCDADYALDLHCDHRAVMHLYASPARPKDTAALCRAVGAKLALIQDVSGGNAFDEAHTVPWLMLRRRFGDRFPIPDAAFSTTLEYRGQFDVDDATAAQDARNLMTFLAAIGVVLDWPEEPAHQDAMHLPLGGAVEVFAPQGGVVTWCVDPGQIVAEGAVLAHVTDPVSRARMPVCAPVAGMMFRQELWRSCLRGQGLAHVASENVLHDGNLLSD